MKRLTFKRGIIFRVFLVFALMAGMASFPGRGARAAIDAASFAAKVDFSMGNIPASVAIGDLDGDGKPDLAVANEGSNNISVLRNTSTSGSVSFATNVDFGTGHTPIGVAIGDLDGDGKPDLAIPNYTGDTVSVLRNTSTSGNVSFAANVDFGTGSYPIEVAIGDLDGDGKPDLAVANIFSNTISVLRNTSTSGSVLFAAKVDFGTGGGPASVAISDLDGDGKPDLAVANTDSNTVSVLRNTSTSGSVSFAAKVDFGTGNNPVSVAIGDLDGDGKPDLAAANVSSNTVSVLRNTQAPGTFADVPADQWYYSWVERLYAAGITNGCSLTPLLYCPDDSVTRAQMAKFLEKGIHGSAYTSPAGTGNVFVDVPASYWADNWIENLYADGITSGCVASPLSYCPDQTVTRDQMAKFLLKAKHGASYTPPDVGGSTGFGDVSTSYWAAPWIKQLAAEGITSGCGGGNYCPGDPVTRAQMAKFLVLTFNLP